MAMRDGDDGIVGFDGVPKVGFVREVFWRQPGIIKEHLSILCGWFSQRPVGIARQENVLKFAPCPLHDGD